MGILTLVRHAQASFGAANYDVLSDLGQRQSEQLGVCFQSQGLAFSAVLTGTLHRHTQTLAGIAQGMASIRQPGSAGIQACLPAAIARPELNEYDSQALLTAWQATQVQTQPLAGTHNGPPDNTQHSQRKNYFRQLKQALAAWMEGRIAPVGMPDYPTFSLGIAQVLAEVCSRHNGPVLLVSSGGPIAQVVAHILQAPPSTAIALNMQLRNTAVTETLYNPHGHQLLSFNNLPHLASPQDAASITWA